MEKLRKIIRRELDRRKILKVLKEESFSIYLRSGVLFVVTKVKGILFDKKI